MSKWATPEALGFQLFFCLFVLFSVNFLRRRFLLNSVSKYEERNAKALNQIFCTLTLGILTGISSPGWMCYAWLASPGCGATCDQRNWRKGVWDAGFLIPGPLRGMKRTGPLCRSTHSIADLSWEWNRDFMNNCRLWTEKQSTQPWTLIPTCMNWSSLYINVTVSKICQKIKPIWKMILGGVGNGHVVNTRKQMQTCGVKLCDWKYWRDFSGMQGRTCHPRGLCTLGNFFVWSPNIQ